MYQAGYPGLHKSQESFPVQVLSAGNTKGSKFSLTDSVDTLPTSQRSRLRYLIIMACENVTE